MNESFEKLSRPKKACFRKRVGDSLFIFWSPRKPGRNQSQTAYATGRCSESKL